MLQKILKGLLLASCFLSSGACKDRKPTVDLPPLPPLCACQTNSIHQANYLLTVQAQPAGWARLKTCPCVQPEGDRLLTGERRLAFSRQGKRVELQTKFSSQLNARGAPLRLHLLKGQNGSAPLRLEAARIGEQMHIWRQGQVHRILWEGDALEEESYGLFLAESLSKKASGDMLVVRMFSLANASYSDDTIAQLESLPDGSLRAQRWPGHMRGLSVVEHIDSEGLPLRSEAKMGRLRIGARRVEQLPENLAALVPELGDLMKAQTQGTIADPLHLQRARYLLRQLPSEIHRAHLTGPGQQVLSFTAGEQAEVLVQRLPPPTASGRPSAPNPGSLADSYLLGLTRPEIAEQKERFCPQGKGDWMLAQRLRAWVATEIHSDMGMNFADAPTVLRQRRGDCSEKSLLLVALARACDIPARAVAGLIYHQGAFSGHMWTEVWTSDGWRPLDAAYGDGVVSAARIRLEELSLGAEAAEPALLAGRALALGMKVEILESSEDRKPTSPSSP